PAAGRRRYGRRGRRRDLASLRERRGVELIALFEASGVDPRAELLVQARLEAFHARLVGAGEDADELAAAVVADDVLLAAERRERLVKLRVLLVCLDPVDRERLIELRHRVDVAAQALVELRMERHVVAARLDRRALARRRGLALIHQRRHLLRGDVADAAVAQCQASPAAADQRVDARAQLGGGERLGDEVVGAGAEIEDLVGVAVRGGRGGRQRRRRLARQGEGGADG